MESPYVINTATAAELLPQMLDRFRLGHLDPLVFGDTTTPEAAVIPFELLRSLDTRTFEDDGPGSCG